MSSALQPSARKGAKKAEPLLPFPIWNVPFSRPDLQDTLQAGRQARGLKSMHKVLAHPHPAGFLRGSAGICDLRKVI
jgi:hypothetical protein